MSTRYHRSSPFRRFAVRLLGGALVVYFGYHAFHGDHGIAARYRLQDELANLKSEHASLVAERESLERRVALLRPETLDPDMLDERMRVHLNLASPQDVLILQAN